MTEAEASIAASTISWLRAYHNGHPLGNPASLLDNLQQPLGLEVIPPDASFFDIQVLRRKHVARGIFPNLTATLALPTGPLDVTVSPHVIVHASGFVLFRLTVRSDLTSGLTVETMRACERLLWDPNDSVWHFPDAEITGNARVAMNYLFLLLLSYRDHPTTVDPDVCARLALEGPYGCEHLHELHQQGKLPYPYPVSFGTSYEVLLPGVGHDDAHTFAQDLLGRTTSGTKARDIEHDASNVWWYVEENQALVVLPQGAFCEPLDLIDSDRGQLLEYLALRRAALRSVQRDTQIVLTENSRVSRRRLDHWNVVVATTTDDYVLHDRIGCLLVPLRGHLQGDRRLRDLAELEVQVRSNLEAFRGRLDSLTSNVSALVAALFAVLAVALTTGGLVRAVVAGWYSETPNAFSRIHPILSGAVGPILVVIAALVALITMRALSTSVRPMSRRSLTGRPTPPLRSE